MKKIRITQDEVYEYCITRNAYGTQVEVTEHQWRKLQQIAKLREWEQNLFESLMEKVGEAEKRALLASTYEARERMRRVLDPKTNPIPVAEEDQ